MKFVKYYNKDISVKNNQLVQTAYDLQYSKNFFLANKL